MEHLQKHDCIQHKKTGNWRNDWEGLKQPVMVWLSSKRNHSVKRWTVYPKLSSRVKANGAVNHWFTAQSILYPSLRNLCHFCTRESIQAKRCVFLVKQCPGKTLKWLTFALVGVFIQNSLGWHYFPISVKTEKWHLLFFWTEMLVNGTFSHLVKTKPGFLSSLPFIFSWQFARWHKCQKPLAREITWA